MRRRGLRAWRFNSRGFTLVELLAALAILAILAAVALPYAEVMVRREKELDLRRSLREIRTAIDRFHEDWKTGAISRAGTAASPDGYPLSLDELVQGVDRGSAGQGREYYLRRIPADPFGDAAAPPGQQWTLRSYQDGPKAGEWGGQDVYDVHCPETQEALDGSRLADW